MSVFSFASRDIFEELRIFLLLFLAFRSWAINSLKPEYKVLPYLVKIGLPITSTQPAATYWSAAFRASFLSSLQWTTCLVQKEKFHFKWNGWIFTYQWGRMWLAKWSRGLVCLSVSCILVQMLSAQLCHQRADNWSHWSSAELRQQWSRISMILSLEQYQNGSRCRLIRPTNQRKTKRNLLMCRS